MQAELLEALRARRGDIRARWVELLRVEPVNTPLAHPDALAHLVDWTLEEIFRGLATASARRRHGQHALSHHPECPCGRNPLLTYFAIAEQALQEALVLVQAAMAHLDPLERDAALAELNLVLRHVARREIEPFCGLCQYRLSPLPQAESCPHAHAAMTEHVVHSGLFGNWRRGALTARVKACVTDNPRGGAPRLHSEVPNSQTAPSRKIHA